MLSFFRSMRWYMCRCWNLYSPKHVCTCTTSQNGEVAVCSHECGDFSKKVLSFCERVAQILLIIFHTAHLYLHGFVIKCASFSKKRIECECNIWIMFDVIKWPQTRETSSLSTKKANLYYERELKWTGRGWTVLILVAHIPYRYALPFIYEYIFDEKNIIFSY